MRTRQNVNARPIDKEWHRRRQEIRARVYDEDELSEEEKLDFDVGADKAYPLGKLPGVANDDVYTTEPEDEHREPHDIRDRPEHG